MNRLSPAWKPRFFSSQSLRRCALWLTLGALGVAVDAAGAQQAERNDRSRPLEGRWSVTLYLDAKSLRNPPSVLQTTGDIAFGSSSWWVGNADRFGRHSVNLAPFFGRSFSPPANVPAFGPADTSWLTEVSGVVMRDSVRIDFIPRLDHVGVTLQGRFFGDSARGVWYRRANDGSGQFVLHRVSKEAVAVAAIPEPPRLPTSTPTTVVAAAPTTPAKSTGRKGTKSAATVADKPATVVEAKAPATAPTTVAQTKAPASAPTTVSETKTGSPAPGTVAAAKAPATAPATVATAKATTTTPGTNTNAATTVATSTTKPATASAPTTRAPVTTSPATKPPPSATSTATTPATYIARTTTVAALPAPATKWEGLPTPTPPAKPAGTTAPTSAPPRQNPRVVSPEPVDTAGTGSIRVRMFDKASKQWFATQYQLHAPDGTWQWGNLRSGAAPDGWGPVIRRKPGRYEVMVENFVCGDKYWFFENKILKPIEVRAGAPTDVTIEVDLTAEPAKVTLDNKTGAKCTAGPGAPR